MVNDTHPPQAHIQLKLFFSLKDQMDFQLPKKSLIRQHNYRQLINNIKTAKQQRSAALKTHYVLYSTSL